MGLKMIAKGAVRKMAPSIAAGAGIAVASNVAGASRARKQMAREALAAELKAKEEKESRKTKKK